MVKRKQASEKAVQKTTYHLQLSYVVWNILLQQFLTNKHVAATVREKISIQNISSTFILSSAEIWFH